MIRLTDNDKCIFYNDLEFTVFDKVLEFYWDVLEFGNRLDDVKLLTAKNFFINIFIKVSFM